MKHLLAIGLLSLSLTACHKNSGGNPPKPPAGLQAKMTGKWTINYVTLFYFDSTGAPFGAGSAIYMAPPGYSYQFNSDKTWTENFVPDSLSGIGMGGTYATSGDSSFTLVNPAAPMPEPCKMDTLTANLFVFYHEAGTHYNGVTPGYIRYRFHMTR